MIYTPWYHTNVEKVFKILIKFSWKHCSYNTIRLHFIMFISRLSRRTIALVVEPAQRGRSVAARRGRRRWETVLGRRGGAQPTAERTWSIAASHADCVQYQAGVNVRIPARFDLKSFLKLTPCTGTSPIWTCRPSLPTAMRPAKCWRTVWRATNSKRPKPLNWWVDAVGQLWSVERIIFCTPSGCIVVALQYYYTTLAILPQC